MIDILQYLKDANVLKADDKINSNWAKIIPPDEMKVIAARMSELGVTSLSQLVWCLSNGVSRPRCPTCGSFTRFLSSRTFRRYCSAKCAAASNSTKEKRRQTTIQRYGVNNVSQHVVFKKKQSDTAHKNFTSKMANQIGGKFQFTGVLNSAQKFNFICSVCKSEFQCRVFTGRNPRCYSCQPHTQSNTHVMVREMLDELGVRYIEHDRSIIKPLELDFYIPDFQMAIEVNGIYWHSEQNGRDKYAHQRKTLRCLELGVSLIHLFEDQIVIDLEKIKRRLHENYISARGENLHFDGILEVDGCWPLPQWFSARPIGISSPRRYQVNSEFTKQNPTLWDSGTIYYESLQ